LNFDIDLKLSPGDTFENCRRLMKELTGALSFCRAHIRKALWVKTYLGNFKAG